MNDLTAIAQALRTAAEATAGPAQHRLSRGLTLTLQYRPGEYTLSLTRQVCTPSPREEAICRQAFAIPKEARRRLHKSGDYHIIRLIWTEPAEAQPDAAQAPPAGLALQQAPENCCQETA
jgi:hypothetical protein